MLKREMLALGVMDSLNTEKEVALAEPLFTQANMPVTDSINQEEVQGTAPLENVQDGPSGSLLTIAEAG